MRIAAEGIVKRYGETVLDGCSLSVDAGHCAVIRGQSGGGKSTLLRILAMLEPADEGTVIHGDVHRRPDQVEAAEPFPFLTLVFQQLFLWPHLSIAQNLSIVLSHSRDGALSPHALAMLGRLDIGHILARKPHECSLGQRQRAAIARALLMPTRFLLLDEPSSALDRESQAKLLSELGTAMVEGRGLVIVTHDERSFDGLADQRLLLEKGKLKAL